MQATSIFPFLFYFYIVDAEKLENFIISYSSFNLVHEGIQSKERYFLPSNKSINDIPIDIEHLYLCGIQDYRNNQLIFINESFHQLKSISIGHKCFMNVRKIVLDGLSNLESVHICEHCFRNYRRKEHDDGICRITNCPNLYQIEMGDKSFVDFKSFELSNVNSLQSIKFGQECFYYANLSLLGGKMNKKRKN